MCFSVDSILDYWNDICLIFGLKFERPPLQAVGNKVALHANRFFLGRLYLDDKRMDIVVVAIVRDNIDDSRRIRSDEDFFHEGSLFHAGHYNRYKPSANSLKRSISL